VGFIDVYRNGVMLGSADYTATDGVSVVLATGATSGDLVEVISFSVSSVLNAIPATAGSVGTSNIANGVTINFADGSASTPSITNDGDTNTGMFFPSADTIAFSEGGVEAMRLDSSGNLLFNSGYGSVATAYGCRAWVNFNGTGTVAIRASGNVSSITDNGTGDYTVNFTTAISDVNYSAIGQRSRTVSVVNADFDETFASRTTTSTRWVNVEGGSVADSNNINIAIFR
jgi:hypothetical protein